MTNLLNVLKTMENETTGVKNDVLQWLIEDYSEYSPQEKLNDLFMHGCHSGMVSHLIYYSDTVEYFEEHETEIIEMLEDIGININSCEGIDTLSEFIDTDDFDARMNDDEIESKAREFVKEIYNITDEEIESDLMTYGDDIFDEKFILATTLNQQDKNNLVWAIFEREAQDLQNELEEMGEI